MRFLLNLIHQRLHCRLEAGFYTNYALMAAYTTRRERLLVSHVYDVNPRQISQLAS